MNALIKTSTLIMLGLLGALASAGLIHMARVDLAFNTAMGSTEALRQVRQRDPTHPYASSRIGRRWMQAFPPRYDLAATAFHDTAAAAPFDAYHWLDYARASLRLGRRCQTARALDMAERVDKTNQEVQLDLGNIRLEMNDLDRATANHARAITLNPNFADQLCPFYQGLGWTPLQVAKRLLCGNQDLLEHYFSNCLGTEASQPEGIAALWDYIISRKDTPKPGVWQTYFNYLVRQRKFGTAKELWGRIAQKFYLSAWDSRRELFWNGNLARPFAFSGGMEWRTTNQVLTGCAIEIGTEQTNNKTTNRLRLIFDGTANINTIFASHGLLLEPGRAYHLRCLAGAHDITTDNAPYLALSMGGAHPTVIRSRMLTESGKWDLELQFTAPQDCGWAELTIRRDLCTRLNNKIKGEAWFGNFTLEPSESLREQAKVKP